MQNRSDATLPKVKSKPEEDLAKYITLLYGQEKIGKTTFCAQFKDALFLFFEPGGKDLSLMKMDIVDWEHFRDVLKNIEKDDRFKNVIFDTVDVGINMCEKWACQQEGISDPSQGEYGSGWRAIRREFNNAILRLTKTGKGVFFTSHATEKTYKTRDGKEVDRIVPTMNKQAREIIEPLVDIWAYYRYTDDKGNREILLRGNEEVSAGTRTENHFIGFNAVPAGKTPKQAYENFIAAFENRLPGSVPPAPVVASKPAAKFFLKPKGGK